MASALMLHWHSFTPWKVRTAGGILQILGVLEIAAELTAARRQALGTPWWPTRLWRRTWPWIRRVILRRPPKIVSVSGTASATASASATAKVIRDESRMSTLERLDYHRERLDAIEKNVEDVGRTVGNERAARERALGDLARSLGEETDKIRTTLRKIAAGGLTLRWWGLFSIVVGIALATWPAGFAYFLR